MITLLCSPKPFKGLAREHQYRAIQSWQAAADGVEVILYGNSDGIDEAGANLGVRVQKEIGHAPSGIPYFGAIAEHAAEHGKYDLQVYLNCDILLSGIPSALRQIEFEQFLLIGQRIDLAEGVVVDLATEGWFQKVACLAAEGKAVLHSPTGIDYFGFRRGMWRDVPPIIIGRGGYDNALLAYCMRNRIPIVDGTFAVLALHPFHDYGHMNGGVRAVMRGPDAVNNLRQAGGPHSAMLVSDSSHVLIRGQSVPWPCRGDQMRHLELRIRYCSGWPSIALVMRLIWRILQVVGLTRVPQPSLGQVMDGLSASLRSDIHWVGQ